jgi:tetratricopeptide (TPR) repeat protein
LSKSTRRLHWSIPYGGNEAYDGRMAVGSQYRFDVALSFPGENRVRVERIAEALAAELGRERVLYDKWYRAEFARPRLDLYLPKLYHERSRLIVFFFSKHYAKKEWCGLEWDVGRELLKSRHDSQLMFLRFDRSVVPGLLSIHGGMDIANLPDAEVALDILNRLRQLQDYEAPQTARSLTPTPGTRVWKPRFVHGLQQNQHFRGREDKLSELSDWLKAFVTADRVISVVAPGGTGKTALVCEVARRTSRSNSAGVFFWSFYEDSNTDTFLGEAYDYFSCEKQPPRDLLYGLLQALSDDEPHVLILDGLERLQSDEGYRRRGELEDPQLKRLLRALASGEGNARALVTSRFPLVDLDSIDQGHRVVVLDDLDFTVALEVLRDLNLKGDDAVLARLIEPLNMGRQYHALSVAAYGSYLANYPDGPMPDFALNDAKESDPKAWRLSRILEEHAKALSPPERDLLVRLSLFPQGLKIEVVNSIVQCGGQVSGALFGVARREVRNHLERLRVLRLVFRYETDQQLVYSAHPFIQDFFRNLLATPPEAIHEVVRARLAPSLKARPSTAPTDPVILEQYETLIAQTLLAGRVHDAFGLYWHGLGGYRNLGSALAENARGLRTLERFVPKDNFSLLAPGLTLRDQSRLLRDLGMFCINLGELARARRALSYSRRLNQGASERRGEWTDTRLLADVELQAANFPQALAYSEMAASLAERAEDETNSLAYRATAHFAMGEVTVALSDFQRATELERKPLSSLRGIWEAESKALRGDRSGALTQTVSNRQLMLARNRKEVACRCDSLLARLHLPANPTQSARDLQRALVFANQSGEVELQLRCFLAACELQQSLGDYSAAITEAEAGVRLATSSGYGRLHVDLLIASAETHLLAGKTHEAIRSAREALNRSEDANCQYAWGRADGLHFCGIAHLRLDEYELALRHLTTAAQVRERLGHARIQETLGALESCRL